MATAIVETTIQDPVLDATLAGRLRNALVVQRSLQLELASDSGVAAAGDPGSIVARELAAASAVRARQRIQEIEAALNRMDLGTYGLCQRCQVPIPIERLDAVPDARFCVRCAQTSVSPLG